MFDHRNGHLFDAHIYVGIFRQKSNSVKIHAANGACGCIVVVFLVAYTLREVRIFEFLRQSGALIVVFILCSAMSCAAHSVDCGSQRHKKDRQAYKQVDISDICPGDCADFVDTHQRPSSNGVHIQAEFREILL